MTKLEKAKEIVRQAGHCCRVYCDHGCENECPLSGRCSRAGRSYCLKEAERYISEHEIKRGDWVYVSDVSEEDALNRKIMRQYLANVGGKYPHITTAGFETIMTAGYDHSSWYCAVPVPTVKKMTVSEVCKELGYDVEIVKE